MDSPENKGNYITVRIVCLIVVVAVLFVVICFSLLGGGIDGEKLSTTPAVAYKKLTEYITPNTPSKPLESREIVKRASQQELSGGEYYDSHANPALPLATVVGQWQSQIGDLANASLQTLLLTQQEQLITGQLGHYPVVAWLKGNVFQMTVRRSGTQGQVRFRYRGAINAAQDQIRGVVTIALKGTEKVEVDWVATKQ